MIAKIKHYQPFFVPIIIFLIIVATTIFIAYITHNPISNQFQEAFDTLFGIHIIWIILLVGLFIAILVCILTFIFREIKHRAAILAEKMTADLLSSTNIRQAILDGANYSIISTDPNGIIRSFNAAAEKLLGYQASELIGKETPVIIHDRNEMEQRAKELTNELGYNINPDFEVLVAKTRRTGVDEREWTYIGKNGSRFPVQLSMTAIKNPDGVITGFMGIASDLSPTIKANKYIRLEYEIIRIITKKPKLSDCLGDVVRIILDSLGWSIGILWKEDQGKQHLICHDIWYKEDPSLDEFIKISRSISLEPGVGLPGRVWLSKREVIIENIQEVLNCPRTPFFDIAGLRSVFGFPLLNENQFVGIFEFFSKQNNAFTDPLLHNFFVWLGQELGALFIRNIAEENLRKNDIEFHEISQRLKLATESAKIGIWDWDIKTNKLLWDDIMFQIFGQDPNQFTHNYEFWRKTVHPEDIDNAEFEVQNAVAGKWKFNSSFRIIWPDKSVHYIRAIGVVMRDKDGNPLKMIGVNWDITKEKTAEHKLQMIIETAPNAIILANTERTIVLVNRQTEELFGYSREELIGQKVDMLIPERYRDHHPIYMKQYIEKPTTRPMGMGRDLFGLKKNGEIVPVEIGLNPMETVEGLFILASIINISERKKTAEEKLLMVIESTPNAIIMVDIERTIVLVNLHTEKLFGYHRDELIGKKIEMLIPKRLRKSHPQLAQEYINDLSIRSMAEGREIFALKKSGEEIPVEIGLNPLETLEGSFILATIIDLTERKKNERMKIEFVSTVSHELRTPLTSIQGALGLINGGGVGEVPEKIKSLIKIAYNNCERLIRLINDILDIDQINLGKMVFKTKNTNLRTLIKQAIEINTTYATQFNVTLSCNEINKELTIYVDPDRIMQVLTNLISNAVKFSPKGGNVMISAVVQKNGNTRINVIDHGPGIPEEFKNRIFLKFSQADSSNIRKKGGTGLGLSICKEIIEKHGGFINYESETGHGTTFYFELPPPPSTAIKSSQDIHMNMPRFLVVEDDADAGTLIRHMIEHEGMQADIALNAAMAKKMLAEKTYSGMTLDIILPDQNGISLIRELRENEKTKDLPIIVISGQAIMTGKNDIEGYFPVIDWLSKPIDLTRFIEAVNKIVNRTGGYKPNILHVEDDEDTSFIASNLLNDIANVQIVTSTQAAKLLLKHQEYDLLILDLNPHNLASINLLTLLNQTGKKPTPIIIISASEVDASISKKVEAVLLKSKTSHDLLRNTINEILAETRKNHNNRDPNGQ